MKVNTSILAIVALLIGIAIYLVCRAQTLVVFDLIEYLNLSWLVLPFRAEHLNIPEWIKYSLPDGLWVFTYMLYVGVVYSFNIERCKIMLSILPLVGICSECLQYYGIFPGTFDIVDLIAYMSGIFLGLVYIIIIKQIIKNSHYGR